MNTKSFLSILALVVTLLAGGAFMYTKSSADTASAPIAVSQTGASPVEVQPLAITTIPAANTSAYKDGTYTATGNYAVPEGKTESLTVSVTVSNGVIVDSTATGSSRDHDSRRFTQQFVSGYKALVTGKSLDAVKLKTVSGSSLTSSGWNAAIESIKQEAAV